MYVSLWQISVYKIEESWFVHNFVKPPWGQHLLFGNQGLQMKSTDDKIIIRLMIDHLLSCTIEKGGKPAAHSNIIIKATSSSKHSDNSGSVSGNSRCSSRAQRE